ncbi:type B 50S ribosomal protein L31 [Candidatus Peregrinibacteria bacterium]|nr:type B 50S ribosomal protein L31 [Candidatus Peregrinibacteria bacterium]
MKDNIHPKVYPVVYLDTSSGAEFISTSTKKTSETKKIGNTEYFVIRVEVSSSSHPFFTGQQKLIDTAGRVDKFMARVKKAQSIKEKEVKKIDGEMDEMFTDEEKGEVKPVKKAAKKAKK